ncbi:diguanylate cyclase [Pontibacterium granulatum]|uniref:GGDEF domain-containing response regulator n=1 Tax=Pontibacterium granulatum TaxID=2036029 RepID=UPI00249BF9F7|nr:diguanylate cyclase [Pontibacterium granulatum]MDI3326538.1 diguanylate cyclase [Pontibacterium granulatum]
MDESLYTILVVDSGLERRVAFKSLFSDCYQVVLAENGEQALHMLESELLFDLVILGENMSVVSNFDVLKSVHHACRYKDTPVLMIANSVDVDDEVRALKLGVADYIHRPFDPVVLRLRVKNTLKQAELLKQLITLADTDYLTGLNNRRSFATMFDRVWRRSARTNSRVSLAILDIDFFKRFNDRYGHAEGDKALKKVSEVLREHFRRATDFVARYGGEEFVILCTDIEAKELDHQLAKTVQAIEALQLPHESSNVSKWLTVSVGVAVVNAADGVTEKLFKHADRSLYAAKSSGRNCVLRHSEALEGGVVDELP